MYFFKTVHLINVFLILLWVFLFVPAYGQDTNWMDTVLHKLKTADQLKYSHPSQAGILAKDALVIAEKQRFKEQEALAHQLLSRLYTEKGDHVLAVESALKALRTFDELNNEKQICGMYIILGVIYRYQKHFEQSLEYYRQAEKVALENNLDTLTAAIWGNMGNVYYDLKLYEEALSHHHKSLEIDRAFNNVPGIGNTYHNIGMVHKSKGDFLKALEYYRRSLDIDIESGNQRNLMISYLDFTEIYLEMKDFQQALSYASKALGIAESTNFVRLKSKAVSYLLLIHSSLGNHKQALEYFKEYHNMTDSLNSATLSQQIADMQINYEMEQKEKELAQQNLHISTQRSALKQQQLFMLILIGSLLFIGLIVFMMFNRYKLKQKNRQLQLENEQISLSINLKERLEVDETINYFATSLFGKNTIDEILWDVAKNCINRLGLVDCVIYLLDEQRNVLVQKAAYGEKNPEGFTIHQPIEIPMGKGIVGSVAQSGEAEIINDTRKDPRYIVDDEARSSEIAVPLIQQNKVIGIIDSEHPEKDFFRRQHLDALQTIAAICTSKISQTQAQEEAEKAREAQIEADNIKKLDLMKSRFFANISHEFRTPLNLILAPLQSSKETINTYEMEMMRRNAGRLLRLVNQLLDLAKIEVGLMAPVNRNIEISRFIKGIADSFSPFAEAKDIDYMINVPERDHLMFLDPDKLEKILSNLLSNAFKFTPKGGTIGLRLVVEPEVFKIEVSDTGIGIPEDLKGEIFKRFYQIDASQTREYEGSGIGLSLTKELVDLLNGTIDVESRLGKGCVFSVSFPYTSSSENLTDIENEIEDKVIDPYQYLPVDLPVFSQDSTGSIGLSKDLPLVLFVEDNQDLRSYVKSRLSAEFNILEAANGKEGLLLARQKVPDLIVTDIMMPKMDGVDLTKQLRKDEVTSHIPIIMLTARDDAKTKIKGFETGAEQYLVKPFEMDELCARINSLLAQRNRLQQKFNREVILQPEKVAIDNPDAVFLKRIMAIIEENLSNEAFTVEQLQKEIGMSRMQLHRKLKALTNQAASEFVRSVKLKRAAQILSQPGIQVAEAAYLSGFSHLSYFTKCFKEQYGVAPSVYAGNASDLL